MTFYSLNPFIFEKKNEFYYCFFKNKYLVKTFKGSLSKIFVIKYITLKQTPLILKTFPSECILHRVSIFICIQAHKYVQ